MLGKTVLIAAAAAVASVHAQHEGYLGFNYGASKANFGPVKVYEDFKEEFDIAHNLAALQGKFNSARLYTMIQGPSKDDPISAIQAAIDTNTTLLLGIWASAGQDLVTNEINALKKAIDKYGTDFTNLVVGLSIGSEDLYRNSPMGIENESGLGAHPDELVNYINQVRKAVSNTPLKDVKLGHVDTWTVWVNGSNKAVVDALDWIGFDAYPYFQSTMANPIEAAYDLFWEAYENTEAATGKPVWITETGWPVTGKDMNLAKAGVKPAQQYWNEVGCEIFGKYNTWWYMLRDADPTPPEVEFGVVDAKLKPYYDLSCKNVTPRVRSSSSSSSSSTATATQATRTGGTFTVETTGASTSTTDSADSTETTGAPSSAFAFKAAVGMVVSQVLAVIFLLL